MTTETRTRILSGFIALLMGTMSLGWTATAYAANIKVDTLIDGSLAGFCTLSDAFRAAKNDIAVNGCAAGSGPDTITFGVSGTINMITYKFVDSGVITLDGAGQTIVLHRQSLDSFGLGFLSVGSGATVQLKNLAIVNCTGYNEGAIQTQGTLIVSNVTFSNNGDPNITNGAILNSGNATISGSTFSGNAGFQGSAVSNSGTLTISNSTFYGNSGGAAIVNGGTLNVINATISGNSSDVDNGTIGVYGGTTNLANIILTNNTGGECFKLYGAGVIAVSGVNIVDDTTCGTDPAHLLMAVPLGPLANNGGPTMTMALLPGSPAIDAADKGICAAAPVNNLDQRGQPRSTDAKCDIGAYESVSAFTITPIPGSETIAIGHAAGFILQIDPVAGFRGSVKLSCSGGPAGTQCGVFPESVAVSGKVYAVAGILFPRVTPGGTYTIAFTGASGTIAKSATANVTLK